MSQGSAGVAAEITNEGSTSSFASFRGGRRCYSTNARQTSFLRLYVQIFICPVRLKKKQRRKNSVTVTTCESWLEWNPGCSTKKIRSKARWARSPEHSPSRQPVTARRTGRRPEGTWREAGEGAGAARCGPRGPGTGHPGLVGSPPSDLSTALHLAATPPRGTGSRQVPPGVAGSGPTPLFTPSGGRWLRTTSWCVDAKWLSDAGRNGDTQCRAFTFFAPGGGAGSGKTARLPPPPPAPHALQALGRHLLSRGRSQRSTSAPTCTKSVRSGLSFDTGETGLPVAGSPSCLTSHRPA